MSIDVLSVLQADTPDVRHLATTIHGPGFGLDEVQALLSQFQGYVDALQAGIMPSKLQRITIVERSEKRTPRLQAAIDEALAEAEYATRAEGDAWVYELRINTDDAHVDVQEHEPDQSNHALVAMPETDYFYYGVQGAVHAYGLLCERFHTGALSSEQWAQIQVRLDTAAVMIADVTDYTADLALQIGYALGRGCPVVLIGQSIPDEPFEGVSTITYDSIRGLETAIKAQMDALKSV